MSRDIRTQGELEEFARDFGLTVTKPAPKEPDEPPAPKKVGARWLWLAWAAGCLPLSLIHHRVVGSMLAFFLFAVVLLIAGWREVI